MPVLYVFVVGGIRLASSLMLGQGGAMGDAIAPTKHLSVFISYVKQDELIADYVQNSLNRAGYRTSTFTSITPGDRWISSINQSLENVDIVVILLSKAAMKSPWILYEISASVASAETGSGKQVIPVALGKDVSPSGVLAQYQWIITSGDPHEVADLIIEALAVPRRPDKDQERQGALKNLWLTQNLFDEEVARYAVERRRRDTRFAGLLILLFLLVLALLFGVSIYLAASGKITIAALGFATLATAFITGLLGFGAGRIAGGMRDDRPDK
jgi:TIR domain